VDLDSDWEELLAVLERNLTELPHGRRFKWIYRDNPLGPAWSWFACDSSSGRVVGVASVFPRAMWIGPRVSLCGQVGDFAIDPSHRSLGPALMLQRATFGPVDHGLLSLCYDCPPHERGMSTFRRLGMTASTTMTRYARLLRTDRQLSRLLGNERLAGWITPLANPLLRFMDMGRPRPAGLEVSLHEGQFGDEFSDLDRRAGARGIIRGRRAAEDLNWRYRTDPLHAYVVLTARRRGELVGFVVLAVTERDAVIVDLFGVLIPADADALLYAAVDHMRPTQTETVHALVSGASEAAAALRRAGFRRRGHGPYVVIRAPGSAEVWATATHPLTLDLTHSDVMA
jgi:GNAT superfamily N-acetyltransferase